MTYETQEITNANVEGEGATAILKTEIGTTKIYIDCQKTTLTGKIEKGDKSSLTIKYSECKLYEGATGKVIASCTVENITATASGEVEAGVEEKFSPTTGEEFTKIKITGATCVLKGAFELKGTQKCGLPNARPFMIEHEISCSESGSSLKLGTKSCVFRGSVKIKLEGKEAWVAAFPWGSLIVKGPKPLMIKEGETKALLAEYDKNGWGEAAEISVTNSNEAAFKLEGGDCNGKPLLAPGTTCEMKFKCIGTAGAKATISVRSSSWFVSTGTEELLCTA